MFISIIAIVITIISIVLVALNIVKDKYYQYLIYIVALLALYSTTMIGSGVVGSDISAEAFMSKEALRSGWDVAAKAPEATSFVVGWLVPLLSNIFAMDVVWVYKLFIPMIFALCPVLLYFIYAKQIDKPKALVSAMFFIIMPVFGTEIATIGKSMVAEVFLAVAIYALIANWNKWIKYGVIFSSLALTLWAHYSVGIIALLIFFAIAVGLLVARFIKKWGLLQNFHTSWWALLAIVAIISWAGSAYFSVAGGGGIAQSVTGISHDYPDHIVSDISSGSIITENVGSSYLNKQGVFIRSALGFDFFETTDAGRAFRIIQFITQFLIILGCAYILFRYKEYKFKSEFIIGIGASMMMLLTCIFLPYVSSILNMTRFYQLSLFFLAPTFIIGVDALGAMCKKTSVIICCALLIWYYIFTSGLIYEVTQSNVTDRIDVPYSIGLSSERTGVAASYCDDDIKCAEWVANNLDGKKVMADYNGLRALNYAIPTGGKNLIENFTGPMPNVVGNFYIFKTTWNVKNGKYVVGSGIGIRTLYDWPELDYEIAFKSGQSIIYKTFK